jgi:hypothetical protein
VAASSFVYALDARLEALRQPGPNSEEGHQRRAEEIAEYEDLKQKVEAFIGAAASFSAGEIREIELVERGNSVYVGIEEWWAKHHVEICDSASVMSLFLFGVLTSVAAGVNANLAAAIAGAMTGGKPVIDAIKAYFGQSQHKGSRR